MRLNVKVITGAKENVVERDSSGDRYIVKTTTRAEKGKANRKVIELLAQFFRISKSNISIVKGTKCKQKLIEIKK